MNIFKKILFYIFPEMKNSFLISEIKKEIELQELRIKLSRLNKSTNVSDSEKRIISIKNDIEIETLRHNLSQIRASISDFDVFK